MDQDNIKHELDFCLSVWERKWGCKFWGWISCDQCGTPYLLIKLLSSEILHDKLSLEEWKIKFGKIAE